MIGILKAQPAINSDCIFSCRGGLRGQVALQGGVPTSSPTRQRSLRETARRTSGQHHEREETAHKGGWFYYVKGDKGEDEKAEWIKPGQLGRMQAAKG
jgi:hypothetical protein